MAAGEQLSALADGELQAVEVSAALAFAASEAGRERWQSYQLIGESLRAGGSQALQPVLSSDGDLLQRLRAQMALEGPPLRQPGLMDAALQPIAAPLTGRAAAQADPAANAQLWRWKLAAGFASLAAVALLGWNSFLAGQAPAAQLAAAPARVAPVAASVPAQPLLAQGQAVAGSEPVMIRDPRLDELLAAHRQLGNTTTALQMPAGFLRNASFAGPER